MRPQAFRLSVVAVVLVASLLASGQTRLAAVQTGDQGTAGEPGPTAAGSAVDPRQVPIHERDVGPEQVREVPRRYPVDQSTFGQLKSRANAAAAAQSHLPGGTTGGETAPTPNFATLDTGSAGGWNPADAGLAVGPSSVLVAVNEAFAFYGRDGSLLGGPWHLQDFFGTTDSVFDPRALYDKASGRFVLLAVTSNSNARTSSYMLAVSQSGATTTWCKYALNAVPPSGTASWADFPGLGMDGDYLYITSNQFSFGGNSFQYARLLAVSKASVYADTSCRSTAQTWDFRGLQNPGGGYSFTVQPANQPDAVPGQASGTMYLVNAIWSSGSNIVLRAVTAATGQAPKLGQPNWVSSCCIAAYDLPADALQPGGSAIDTGDTRLLGATQRSGTIYTGNTTKTVASSTPNAYANGQWYEITPTGFDGSGLPTSKGASHAVADPNVAYYYPAVLAGQVEISGSGPSQPASMYYVGSDGAPTLYALGAAGYTLNGRWGDYAAVSADPNDSSAVWALGQYVKASNAWGMAVRPAGAVSSVAATTTPTPTPTVTATATPTATSAGSLTATPTAIGISSTPTATATGTTSTGTVSVSGISPNAAQRGQQLPVTVSGSGFQSGATANFGDRVIVQSVTFGNSGSLQVRLRVQTQAATGPRDVIITNPDGSSAKLPGGFTVNP